MKRTIGFVVIAIIVITSISLTSSKLNTLVLISSIPDEATGPFFKNTPVFSIDPSGLIFALDNRLSELHRYDPHTGSMKTIAKKGQGPGELSAPAFIAVDGQRIYVKDDNGISIFDKDGLFRNRFRTFQLAIDLAAENGRIYLAQAGTAHLINVYDLEGNKISSFGSKYPIDYDLYKGWSPELTDRVINTGRILISPTAIYFISTLFGDAFIYSKDGHWVGRKKLVPRDLVKEIEEQFFRVGLKGRDKGGYGLLVDISYIDGYFFGLVLRRIYSHSPGDIIRIAERSLVIDEAYRFARDEMTKDWRFMNMGATKGPDGKPEFYLSYYDDKLAENKISLFRKEGER